MLFRDIAKILGYFLFGLAAALFGVMLVAAYYEFWYSGFSHPQPHSTQAFFISFLSCLFTAMLFAWWGRNSSGNIYRREGLFVVVIIWFICPVFCGLPFWLSDTLRDPFQAYFEAASGLTTTGATCMTAKHYNSAGDEIPIRKVWCGTPDTEYVYWGNINPVRDFRTGTVIYEGIEAAGKALLFWRSALQWLGGMGIILLFAAILPALGVGGKVLFQAELTGPIKSSLTPRLKETASHLWKVYFSLTLLEVLFLALPETGVPLFDAITISFSTLSTGGFSVRNEGIGAYSGIYVQWVIILFMLVGSINFGLFYFLFKGNFYRIKDTELITYFSVLFVACCIGIPLLHAMPEGLLSGVRKVFDLSDSIRLGAFHLISAMTTTGFSVANYDKWPYAFQALMLILSFSGGMAGSTSGGIKIIRQYMLFRIAQYKTESLFRPETIRSFRVADREVDNESAIMVLCFMLVVLATTVSATFIYICFGVDPETALGCVSCMINNTGVAFRMAGPTESFAFLSNGAMMFSAFIMILGRLEYFAILAVLVPAFWKRR